MEKEDITQENIKMVSKGMKRCPIMIRLVRVAKIKKSNNPYADEDVEKLDHSSIAGMDVKWFSYSGKQFYNFV